MKDNKEMLNVKVGYEFIRIAEEDIKANGIEIEKTGAKVHFNHQIEDLYRGASFDESAKIDKLIDKEFPKYVSYRLNEYLIEGKQAPTNLYEYLNFMIEKRQKEVYFDAMDTPFTTEEITELCTDYIYDYSGQPMTDYISEYADSQVSIYYSDIYENAAKFAEWTDEAVAEFGVSQDTTLDKILQMGEYKAYFDALYKNTEEMGLYCALENSKDWLKENKELIEKIEPYLTSEERLELITTIEERIEDAASEYANDNYYMGEYIEGTIEGAFENGDTLEEKYEAIQAILAGDDIKLWDVLNKDMDNDGIVDRNDMDFRDSDYLESNFDVDDNISDKENNEKPSILEKIKEYKAKEKSSEVKDETKKSKSHETEL
ncbi:hypothetical protein [Helcococcus ovis]|uniref:hypothetical protein n=1 Tax=Helcococcus ovis TaxID=72026 RepID=UPI0010703ECE|nr:hypothetical protein [Helcococcus ovis]TFF65018.1 hypothetical protein EQF92_03705 [Helcococcus ovis]